jgi:cytochrome P450
MLLFASGEKTTVNLIGNGTLALLRNRAELERLRAQPALMPTAIQELLRYDSPVQLSTRIPCEDVVFGGQTIPAGSLVFLAIGAANRDPARFADADRLDISRADNRHLAFSGGIHYCLGAALALVEAESAIGAIVHELVDLELASDTIEWQREIIFRGPRALPVRFARDGSARHAS